MVSWCLPFFTFHLQNIVLHSFDIYQTRKFGSCILHVKGAIVVFLFRTAEMLVRKETEEGNKKLARGGWFWCRDGTREV
ncbi:hypothetical protein ES332_D09G156800v1 [Gossypium tomentosum]|uniref:Uncharacterized protein n=1 Tax=Gossypium tomentosum TaxID=34277 RepID=A0A5D2JJN2_GOSTO|nr:hypothetical protein ES332_D09G156800v1 [Gossypium tomentosum]